MSSLNIKINRKKPEIEGNQSPAHGSSSEFDVLLMSTTITLILIHRIPPINYKYCLRWKYGDGS